MFRWVAALLVLVGLAMPVSAEDHGRTIEYERIAAAGLPSTVFRTSFASACISAGICQEVS